MQRDELKETGAGSLKRSEIYPLPSCPLIKSRLQERAWDVGASPGLGDYRL